MQDFKFYFGLGADHILTWEAMDHILFVAALCLRYLVKDWKKILILVTAFTIGHCITLALSALNYTPFPIKWIEFAIPLTIAITAINNLLQKEGDKSRKLPWVYFFALFFGLIHGLAYASSFLDLEGRDNLLSHLLAFNLGIEVAQLFVVAAVLLISFILVQLLKIPALWWMRISSVLILLFSLKMAYDRFPNTKNHEDEKALFVPVRSVGTV
ncbi:MAG: HupE/UreJ family protein [Gemmatimonadaceae bacterium]|nr:HupE/UreJ family protein [Chitinophagaceae bacterium]